MIMFYVRQFFVGDSCSSRNRLFYYPLNNTCLKQHGNQPHNTPQIREFAIMNDMALQNIVIFSTFTNKIRYFFVEKAILLLLQSENSRIEIGFLKQVRKSTICMTWLGMTLRPRRREDRTGMNEWWIIIDISISFSSRESSRNRVVVIGCD